MKPLQIGISVNYLALHYRIEKKGIHNKVLIVDLLGVRYGQLEKFYRITNLEKRR